MYKLHIPQAKPLETALQSVDSVHRYTDLMMGHVTSPVTLLDVPCPIYVLRNIAKAEETTFDGLQDIVSVLKDTAYIASTVVTSAYRNGNVNKTSGSTFTSSETKDIRSMMVELYRRASSHKAILPQLQDLQQKCWDSHNHLTKRQILLKSQEKKLALLEKDHVSYDDAMRKWLNYRMKEESSTSAHNTMANYFREMLYKERRLRLDMEELEQELRKLLCRNIEIRLRKTLENMATTIELVDLDCSNTRYQILKSRIKTINARDIAESLLPKCSMEYEYPNIQEFIKVTGFSEPLPRGHMVRLPRHRTVQMDYNELMTSSPGSIVEEMKDRNSNNGCYLKVIGSKPSPGPEFLKLKRDHTFKQKLTVMNGDVVFGWARKGRLGQKKWGFYDSRLVTRVV